MFGFLKRKRAEKDWAKVGKAYASSVGDGIGDNLNEWFARVRHRDDHTLEGFLIKKVTAMRRAKRPPPPTSKASSWSKRGWTT